MPPVLPLRDYHRSRLPGVDGRRLRFYRILLLQLEVLGRRLGRRDERGVGGNAARVGDPSLEFLPAAVSISGPGPSPPSRTTRRKNLPSYDPALLPTHPYPAERNRISTCPLSGSIPMPVEPPSPHLRVLFLPSSLVPSYSSSSSRQPSACHHHHHHRHTYRSDSVISRIVSHVSNPCSRNASRYWLMPSSPKTAPRSSCVIPVAQWWRPASGRGRGGGRVCLWSGLAVGYRRWELGRSYFARLGPVRGPQKAAEPEDGRGTSPGSRKGEAGGRSRR